MDDLGYDKIVGTYGSSVETTVPLSVGAGKHLYAVDFYGEPAWAFWLLCVAAGVIAGVMFVVR